ncbi:hypothetical protein ACSVH2_06600 [Flavobacterium sp. RSB2_4_14]|uniref:hypothetical protein n=1 Tax=Flavobacterium sp. RSB2_4_14 TaxID=3447665 RepID=UPI003F3E7482
MKKIFILLLVSNTLFAQKSFSEGYYIDNLNNKISGFILFNKTTNTPTEFQFKKSMNSEIVFLNIENTREIVFEEDKIIFERFQVTYDKESVNYADVLRRINPKIEPETKTLFLQKLVDGDVSLYLVTINDFKSYYIKKKNEENVTLLEYKKIFNDGSVREITNYKKQLSENLLCKKLTLNNFLAVDYKENKLKEIINKNNTCDSVFFNYDTIKHSKKIIVTPYVDYSFNTFSYENFGINEDKINRQNINFGIEFSVLTSDINKKFEAFIRISFGKHDFTYDTEAADFQDFTQYYTTTFEPTILSPELGFRYNFVSNIKYKIYSNLSFGYSFTNDDIKVSITKKYDENLNLPDENANITYQTYGDNFIQLGLGYTYDWRYGFEIKYNLMSKNYFERYYDYRTNHNTLSLSFRYSIIKPKFRK